MEKINIFFSLPVIDLGLPVASKSSAFVAVLCPLLWKSVLIFTIKFYLKIVRKRKQEREK